MKTKEEILETKFRNGEAYDSNGCLWTTTTVIEAMEAYAAQQVEQATKSKDEEMAKLNAEIAELNAEIMDDDCAHTMDSITHRSADDWKRTHDRLYTILKSKDEEMAALKKQHEDGLLLYQNQVNTITALQARLKQLEEGVQYLLNEVESITCHIDMMHDDYGGDIPESLDDAMENVKQLLKNNP